MVFATTALADSHTLQPDFTFKRVGVPSAGSGNRINVQVSPAPIGGPSGPAAAGTGGGTGAAGPSDPSAPPALNGLEWFWLAVSPKIADSVPGRLQAALNAIANPPDGKSVPAPRLQLMQDIASVHGREILGATVGTQVSPALVLAMIAIESAGRVDVTSSAGAQGLMQLIPATAERFGVTDSMDPSDNIKGGVAYLDWLMSEFDRDPILVLAAYNAGENAVKNNDGVPPYSETRAYVPKVLAAWAVARGLCQTPPELITDGCVFAVNGS